MDEKGKLIKLRSDLDLIKSKFSELEDLHILLDTSIKNGILVDDKNFDSDNLDSVKREFDTLIEQLNDIIIPMVDSRINL